MSQTNQKKWPMLKGTILRGWPFIVLAIVTALHITKIIAVDGYAIGLLVLTFLPPLLKTLTTYFDTFKFGKDGIEARAVADNRGKTSAELEERISEANSQSPSEAVLKLPYESIEILSTLWHFQKELFGENSLQRWGFGIGIGSPQYRRYENGLQNLINDSLVYRDQRGLCYLTSDGVSFCKKHTVILDANGPYYSSFTPVPN